LKGEFGYDTMTVSSPVDAINELTTAGRGIDVILVDYSMPDMTGLEFLKWMKKQDNQIPVIMLTASGSETIAVEAMKLGAYDYVRKERLDITHLGHTLAATSERRQYRVMKELDEEDLDEMVLNSRATDKAREVLNLIAPALNAALANIDFEVEVKGEELVQSVAPVSQEKVRAFLDQMLKDVHTLEMSVRGLLMLYRNFYVHHDEEREIEEIQKQVEAGLKKEQP
jgi:CheY-like chemotaxis protein